MDNLLIFGLKRGGHHAILNWIAYQSQRYVVHYNDVLSQAFIKGEIKTGGARDGMIFNNNAANCLYIYSFENVDLSLYTQIKQSPLLQGNTVSLCIIRDVYNILASSIQSTFHKYFDKWMRNRIKTWIQYVREYRGETNYCSNKVMFILYNMWFSDVNYRKAICDLFNFSFTDRGFDKVSVRGGGSSFDKRRYDGEANRMNVLNRYKQMWNNKNFWYYLQEYPEIHTLNNAVFDFKVN